MAIYVVTEEASDNGKVYHDTTIYRSSKIAFDEYVSHISVIIWDFNACLDDIVHNIEQYGKDKASCRLFINNTTFSFSDLKGNYVDLTIEKKEYDASWKRYLFSTSSLKFAKKNIIDIIKKVKLIRLKDESLHPQHCKYWTDKKIEILVNGIFKYGLWKFNIDKNK